MIGRGTVNAEKHIWLNTCQDSAFSLNCKWKSCSLYSILMDRVERTEKLGGTSNEKSDTEFCTSCAKRRIYFDECKGKVKLSLCLTKHHAIKTYCGSGGISSCILDIGTRWGWVVSFMPLPLYPQGKSPWYPLDRGLGGPQSRLDESMSLNSNSKSWHKCSSWKPSSDHSLPHLHCNINTLCCVRPCIIQWYSSGLWAGWSVVRVAAGAGNSSHPPSIQTGSGAHPASYPMGKGGSFPGGKAAVACSWPITSIQRRGQECVELCLHSPNTFSLRGARLKHRDNFTFTFTFTFTRNVSLPILIIVLSSDYCLRILESKSQDWEEQ
jgi:hypothetical protein